MANTTTDLTKVNGSITTTPITPAALTSPTPLQTVTPTPDTTNHAGIIDSASKSVADSYATANTAYENATKNLTDTGTGVIDIMKQLQGKTADTQFAQDQAGVNTATSDVNKYISQLADLNAQATSLQREAQAVPLQTQERNIGTGATDRGVAPQDASALRQNAIKALSIAQQSDITSAALTGSQVRLKAAQDKAQQMIDLKYKPLEDELALKTKQYDLNKDALSLIDKKRTEALGAALEKEKQDIADKKAVDTQKSSIQLEAAKNGASPDIQAAIMSSTNVADAIKAAGSSLSSPSTEVVKVGDNSAFLIDKRTGKILKSYAGAPSTGNASGINIPTNSTPTTQALASLAPLVSGFSSVSAQKNFVSAINQLAAKPNNEKAVAEKIVGAAIDNIADSNQRKLVSGDFQMATQVSRLQNLLDDYTTAGGQTGWIKAGKEGGYQFVGKTTDPALAQIGVQIANQLDELARTRTGAVVSSSEEAAFKKILPSTGKTPELNTAITTGLKASLMANVENQLRYSVTGDGVAVIKSALPEVFGDYRSSNPTVQLKQLYSTNLKAKTVIDQIRKDHPNWGATEIMQIYNGQ